MFVRLCQQCNDLTSPSLFTTLWIISDYMNFMCITAGASEGSSHSHLSFFLSTWFLVNVFYFSSCQRKHIILGSLECLSLQSKHFIQITWFSCVMLNMNCPLLFMPGLYYMSSCTVHLIVDTAILCCSLIQWVVVDDILNLLDKLGSFYNVCLDCFFLLVPDDIFLPEAFSLILTLNTKDLITFKLLLLAVSVMLMACLFISCVRSEAAMIDS